MAPVGWIHAKHDTVINAFLHPTATQLTKKKKNFNEKQRNTKYGRPFKFRRTTTDVNVNVKKTKNTTQK